MNRACGLIVAAAVASSGCGDNIERQGLSPDQLLERLRAIPGVTAEMAPTQQEGAHYYVLHFTQLVDHQDPSLGTFQQEVSLLHRDTLEAVPVVVQTSGYADYNLDRPVELTALLAANQVSIEHRYFGESRPVPTDWTKLTIRQMADDEHEIITALRKIYEGPFLTTGGSKGGMTAVYHRRFYPDDVDGTVAYVAPISFDVPDTRYQPFLKTIGPASCGQAVRDLATEMLAHRREAMQARAQLQASHAYTRVAIGPAVEAAIMSLEWTFWQYAGVEACGTIPAITASDDTLFAFLEKISPVSDCDDQQLAHFEPYFYQSYAELGFPDGDADYLLPYKLYSDEDYENELPTPEPEYHPEAMMGVDDFVKHHGERMLFLYGEWDPWTAGKFVLGDAQDSAVFIQPQGTHVSWFVSLERSDRDAAFAMLEAWTGVVPVVSRVYATTALAEGSPRQLPPVRVHAPRAQK
jgi:hypothetical protein